MNQNWIVENLNNAFSTWNGKLTELWGLVTTSPQTFKGGAVWGVMQSLHNAMIGIGYALIVLFFAISLFKNTANFHELKRPEAAVHYLIRFVAAKTLVGYGMDIIDKGRDQCALVDMGISNTADTKMARPFSQMPAWKILLGTLAQVNTCSFTLPKRSRIPSIGVTTRTCRDLAAKKR